MTRLAAASVVLLVAACPGDPAATDGPSIDVGHERGLPPDARAHPESAPCPACGATEVCVDGRCCKAPVPSGTFKVPAHVSWVRYGFAKAAAELEFAVRIVNDPGTKVGLYYAPYNGSIDGIDFYFGIQTDVNNPSTGPTGKGVIFSRWNTLDPANTRVAPGGFIEVGTHEGEFVGVRKNVAWTTGEYTLRVARAEGDVSGDWFDATIKDASGTVTAVGGLKFERKVPTTPAVISASGTGFCEIYSNASDYSEVPAWSIEVRALADGAPAKWATSVYPAYPFAAYPNKDTFYDPATDRVHLTYGGLTPECHPAGVLFDR